MPTEDRSQPIRYSTVAEACQAARWLNEGGYGREYRAARGTGDAGGWVVEVFAANTGAFIGHA